MNRKATGTAVKHTVFGEAGQYGEPSGAIRQRVEACSREKPLNFSRFRPVPQTDTGGRVEYTEALERFTVKELGKLTP